MSTIRQWWFHDRLCTNGPYRFVRHPIYAGGVLLGSLGISLLFNSWIVLLQPVILFAIYSFLVRKEETMMTAVFGEEYQRYAAKTGRLFPRLLS
jgi:protein-S-isoprenylcysteine O-methyltransferase Ste14